MSGSVLAAALDDWLSTYAEAPLAAAVQRLMGGYHAETPPTSPVLATDEAVAAYAAYRMPATFASIRAALRWTCQVVPDLRPDSVLDIGAGTGAASWALADLLSPASVRLLEQSAAAINCGRSLAVASPSPGLRNAEWRSWQLTARTPELPAADLAVAGYLLGELDEQTRDALTRRMAGAARTCCSSSLARPLATSASSGPASS
ncbi:MAG: hypothetical protein NVSMB13_16600 [Mycobacteriales bacterium]